MAVVTLQKLSVRRLMKEEELVTCQKDVIRTLPPQMKQQLLSVMCKRGWVSDDNISWLVHGQVRRLDLSESEVGDKGLVQLAALCPALAWLDLNAQKIPRDNITDAGLSALATRCRQLQVMYVRRCSGITDAAVEQLATHCPQLAELNLSCCPGITDVSLAALGRNCKRLRCLNLSNTKITDEGVFLLSRGECSQSLKELHVEHCRALTDEAVQAIAQFCPNIDMLLFHGCPRITEESRIAVEELMTGGKTMKHLTWTIY